MKTKQQVVRSLQSLTPKQRRRLSFYLSLQFLNSLLDIMGVLLMGLIILQVQDTALDSRSSTTYALQKLLPSNYIGFSASESLFLLLLLSLLLFSLKAVMAPLLQKKLLIFLGGIATGYSQDLTSRLFSKDIVFNQRRTTQESAYILVSGSFITFQGILGFSALALSELVILIGILVLLLTLNVYLTTFMVAYFGLLLFFLNRSLKGLILKQNTIVNDSQIGATTTIQETIASYREVFVNQKIDQLVKTLVEYLRNSINAGASLTWANLIPKYVFDTSVILGISIIGGFAYVFYSPEEAVVIVVFFLLSTSRILPSLLRFNTGLQGIQNCGDAANRLFDLVEELNDSETEYAPDETHMTRCAVDESLIEVDSLSFKYQGATPLILDNLSFRIKKGEFLAVVGPSGSGKSTLVDLLIGVINDPSGSIRIGETTPRLQVRSNPGRIGYVPQNVALFSRSLLENIALGVPVDEIDQVRLKRAVGRSALTELVESLPLGLSTLVGQNGYNFSGGQKQRIGLARAFYSDPEILVLDEATSALDAETEHQIKQMLSSLAGDLTLIVVAHRLATVQKADKVLYLGSGGFSAVGSFEELRIRVPNFDSQAKLLGI
jgi:ABC-type multidrug transport system fused ATPase/permease subunit